MPDHIHMLVSIPPKYSITSFMGYLKGKSALMIFDQHANLKYKYGNRHFWAEGYYGRYILGKQANGIVLWLGGQPAAPSTIGELSSMYSAIRRNSSVYLNFTLMLPPS